MCVVSREISGVPARHPLGFSCEYSQASQGDTFRLSWVTGTSMGCWGAAGALRPAARQRPAESRFCGWSFPFSAA